MDERKQILVLTRVVPFLAALSQKRLSKLSYKDGFWGRRTRDESAWHSVAKEEETGAALGSEW